MNSVSKSLVLAMLLSAAVLSGLRSGRAFHGVRGTGYVRIDDVVKHHPLYPQLSQLDDAIAAINLSRGGSARAAVARRKCSSKSRR